jgi:preprotein translocase subunit SecG
MKMKQRVAYVIPLGSVFVWTLEGLILSIVYVCVPPILQSLSLSSTLSNAPGITPLNVLDSASSIGAVVLFGLGVLLHLIIANSMNSQRSSLNAAGLHMAVGNMVCSGIFSVACNYITLFMDACVLQTQKNDGAAAARKHACLALFESTPYSVLPKIVGTASSVFLVLLLLISIAMAYVCTPHFRKGTLFLSKACLLVTAAQVGLGAAMLMASSTHYPCMMQMIGIKAYYGCIAVGCAVGILDAWISSPSNSSHSGHSSFLFRIMSCLAAFICVVCGVGVLSVVHSIPDSMKPLCGRIVSTVLLGGVIAWSAIDLGLRLKAAFFVSSSSSSSSPSGGEGQSKRRKGGYKELLSSLSEDDEEEEQYDDDDNDDDDSSKHHHQDEDEGEGENGDWRNGDWRNGDWRNGDWEDERNGKIRRRAGASFSNKKKKKKLELVKKYDGEVSSSSFAAAPANHGWNQYMKDALYGSQGSQLQSIFVSDPVRQSLLRQRQTTATTTSSSNGYPLERN